MALWSRIHYRVVEGGMGRRWRDAWEKMWPWDSWNSLTISRIDLSQFLIWSGSLSSWGMCWPCTDSFNVLISAALCTGSRLQDFSSGSCVLRMSIAVARRRPAKTRRFQRRVLVTLPSLPLYKLSLSLPPLNSRLDSSLVLVGPERLNQINPSLRKQLQIITSPPTRRPARRSIRGEAGSVIRASHD